MQKKRFSQNGSWKHLNMILIPHQLQHVVWEYPSWTIRTLWKLYDIMGSLYHEAQNIRYNRLDIDKQHFINSRLIFSKWSHSVYPCCMKLTSTLGTASLVVLQQVQGPASVADRSPLPALPKPGGLLFGVHPELLGVAPIHLETDTVRALS